MTKLSVLYMVRNEEKTISESMSSIKDIADEIVVVDTGSSDKTMHLCRQFHKVKMFSHAWTHNFSAPRNYGIKQCTGDWILYIDGDEVLDKQTASAVLKAVNSAKENVAGLALRIVDHEEKLDPIAGANPKPFFESPQVRVFRNNKKIWFEGRVNETVEPSAQKCGGIDLLKGSVHHWLWKGKGSDFAQAKVRYYNKLGSKLQPPEGASVSQKSVPDDAVPQVNAPKVAIIACAHNCLATTKDCISSIHRHTKLPYNLHLIDNGSTDGTVEYMQGLGRTPIRFGHNMGVAKARNAGAKEALGNPFLKYLCFIDNDTKVTEGWLEGLISTMEADQTIGMVGPLSNGADGTQRVIDAIPQREPDYMFADRIDGFCMLVSLEAIQKVGLFDENFSPYGYETHDLCERIKRAGYKIAVSNRVFVEHRGKQTVTENRMNWQSMLAAAAAKFSAKWDRLKNNPVPAMSPLRQDEPTKGVKPKYEYSFIILVHNRLDMTKQCIKSIMVTSANYELIIVDNASSDGSAEWIKSQVPHARIIRNSENLGVPKARNQGIRASTSDILVIMDNDVILDPGWKDDMFKPLGKGYSMVGIEGWQLDHNWSACYKCQAPHERFDYLGGACTVFKREVFERTGLFDEGFSPAYYEDSIAADRMIPVKINNTVDVVSIGELFDMGKSTIRPDGKEESSIENVLTLSVDPNKPHPILDINNLPDWWTGRFLSDKERKGYEIFIKTKKWAKAETAVYKSNKGYLKNRIKKRMQRSYQEDASAQWVPVKKLVRHKTNKQMVRVDSRFGQTVCTQDHSLMCWNGEVLKESRPQNATSLCSVTIKVGVPENKGTNISIQGGALIKNNTIEFKNIRGNNYRFPNFISYESPLADDFFEMLGWYVSEGSISGNAVGIHTTDKNEFSDICSCMRKTIEREPVTTIYDEKNRVSVAIRGRKVISRHDYVYKASIYQKNITEFIRNTCGKGAINKKIPSFVFTAPERLKLRFLSGLLRGDAYNFNLKKSGHEQTYSEWYKNNAFKFTTISLKLASGLCLLLSTMDKRYSVRYDDEKKAYMVDFVAYRRNRRKPNVKITDLGPCSEYVYDIVVPETHTFVDAMGMLVVHNTDMSIRAKATGFKAAWVPSKKMIHKEHSTLVYGQKSFNYQQAIAKSHTHFRKKMKGEIRVKHEILPPLGKMFKILYLGMYYDYGIRERGTSFEHSNFYPALKEWNKTSEFSHFDFVDIGKTHGIARMSDMLLERVSSFQPDVLFTVFFDENHDPKRETLKRISANIKTIGWFCDSHFRYDNFDRPWADALSYNVTTSASAYQRYVKDGLGLKVIKSQWGASPAYVNLGMQKDIDVSFVGQPHGDRRQVIDIMRRAGVNIQTFGTGWDKRLSFDEVVRTFNISKINLNLNNACDVRYKQIKGRNFEVPACGGFLLTGHAENLGEYYEIGKEIVTFDTTQDMIDKIRYYLAHDKEREDIARAGYERTMRDHTYFTRFDHIFTKIGLL